MMNQRYTTEDALHILEILPEELKGYILSPDTAEKVEKIARTYNLSDIQHKILGQEIGYALMGLSDGEELFRGIQWGVQVNEEIAEKILGDIDETILEKARTIFESVADEYSKNIQGENEGAQTPVSISKSSDTVSVIPEVKPVVAPLFMKKLTEPTKTLPQTSVATTIPTSAPLEPKQNSPHTNPGLPQPPEKKYVSDPYREPLK